MEDKLGEDEVFFEARSVPATVRMRDAFQSDDLGYERGIWIHDNADSIAVRSQLRSCGTTVEDTFVRILGGFGTGRGRAGRDLLD